LSEAGEELKTRYFRWGRIAARIIRVASIKLIQATGIATKSPHGDTEDVD